MMSPSPESTEGSPSGNKQQSEKKPTEKPSPAADANKNTNTNNTDTNNTNVLSNESEEDQDTAAGNTSEQKQRSGGKVEQSINSSPSVSPILLPATSAPKSVSSVSNSSVDDDNEEMFPSSISPSNSFLFNLPPSSSATSSPPPTTPTYSTKPYRSLLADQQQRNRGNRPAAAAAAAETQSEKGENQSADEESQKLQGGSTTTKVHIDDKKALNSRSTSIITLPSALLMPNQKRRLALKRESGSYSCADLTDPANNADDNRKARILEARIDRNVYCHGFIPFRMAAHLLTVPNQFVVHKAYNKDSVTEPILSIMNQQKHLIHLIVKVSDEGNFWIQRSREFESIQELVRSYLDEKEPVGGKSGPNAAQLSFPIPPQDYEIEPDCLPVYSTLIAGEGAFGFVNVVCLVLDDTYVREVAVKYGGRGRNQEEDFMEEAQLILRSQSEWVLEVIGVVTLRAPTRIVMEYSPYGDLKKYLIKQKRDMDVLQLTKFSLDAARGLNHVSQLGLIHRDVAARNFIVKRDQSDLELLRCVLGDFGLCKEGQRYIGQAGDKMSVRWAAPEQQPPRGVSTPASDAWALAITYTELFSERPEDEPYPGLQNEEAIMAMSFAELYGHLIKQIPLRTPPRVAHVMRICWRIKPDERPTFKMIIDIISPLLPTTDTTSSITSTSTNTSTST